MATRKGDGWTDVTFKGKTLGFITGPDRDGLYAAYLDHEKAGSEIVGTYYAKVAAEKAVIAEHLRS